MDTVLTGEVRSTKYATSRLPLISYPAGSELGLGAGSQMLQPLAIAVIGGILASMVLSLVVTPAVHYYIGGRD